MPVRKSQLLIVEDDSDLVSVLREYLEQKGYLVDTATDGLAGLNLITSRTYDAIICDLGLPSIDGMQVIAGAKVSETNPRTPIFVASGLLDESRVARLTALRVARLLRKPFTPVQLGNELAQVIRPNTRAVGYTEEIVDLFKTSALSVLEFYLKDGVRSISVESRRERTRLGSAGAAIDLFGTCIYGGLNFQCNDRFLSKLGAIAFEHTSLPIDILHDFAGELANQIAGKLRNRCTERNIPVVFGLPFMFPPSMTHIPAKLPTPKIHIRFDCSDGAEAHLEFCLGEPDELRSRKAQDIIPIFVYDAAA